MLVAQYLVIPTHHCILSEGMKLGAIDSVEYETLVYGNKLNMNMHK